MKKNLIIILGGPDRNLTERIRFSEKNLPWTKSDILFTGFQYEYDFFLHHISEKSCVNKPCFVHSYDTWTNIRNTKRIWEKYEMIHVATEKYHGIRTKKLFEILGRKSGIVIHDTGGIEATNAKLLCSLYSTLLSAWCMSIIARILRFSKK